MYQPKLDNLYENNEIKCITIMYDDINIGKNILENIVLLPLELKTDLKVSSRYVENFVYARAPPLRFYFTFLLSFNLSGFPPLWHIFHIGFGMILSFKTSIYKAYLLFAFERSFIKTFWHFD